MADPKSKPRKSLVLFATRAVLVKAGWLFPVDRLVVRLPYHLQHVGVDTYVLGAFALTLVALFAIPFSAPEWAFRVVVGVALYRLVDIYRTQLRITLVDVDTEEPGYQVLSLTRSLVLTLVNFLELIVIFALFFRAMERLIDTEAFAPALTSRLDAALYSVSTATTSGFADIHAVDRLAKAATIAEVLLAIVLLAVVLNLFLSSRGRIRQVRGRPRKRTP